MRIQVGALAIGSALVFGACASTQQQPHRSPKLAVDCSGVQNDAVAQLYAPGTVKEVTPLYRREFVARAIQPTFVSGAKLHIPAQPNMTDAYMERVLSCHAAARAQEGVANPADPFSVAGIEDVDVKSVGPMTHISITSTSRTAGRQILQHAEALRDAGGTVSVEQLSSAAPVPNRF